MMNTIIASTRRLMRPQATGRLQQLADVLCVRPELVIGSTQADRVGKKAANGCAMPRILVVDDNAGVLEDFRKILADGAGSPDELDSLEAALFENGGSNNSQRPCFDVDLLLDGEAACENAVKAREALRPYMVAFVDMRMPGGWDGLKTIEELWRADPDIEVVICTAYSDVAWHEITARLGRSDQLLILRKPFEMIEVQQLAAALSQKWYLHREEKRRLTTLEQRVEERTEHLREALNQLEVANGQLASALEAAAAGSQAKSQFLAVMSHELRTPLNAVIGFSEMLAAEAYGPLGHVHYKEYAQTIADSGTHLLDLVNDVLDLSKLDAERLELQEESVDLVEVATDAIRMMRLQAEKAGIELIGDIDAHLPSLRADKRRLRQVLLNLLSNAVKFTPERGNVRLSASRREGHIAIEIADTGIGMAPEHIPTALERFGQIDSRLSRRYDGTGLGLPLSKRLVELHGGTLAIESALGVGTTVTVIIPGARAVKGTGMP